MSGGLQPFKTESYSHAPSLTVDHRSSSRLKYSGNHEMALFQRDRRLSSGLKLRYKLQANRVSESIRLCDSPLQFPPAHAHGSPYLRRILFHLRHLEGAWSIVVLLSQGLAFQCIPTILLTTKHLRRLIVAQPPNSQIPRLHPSPWVSTRAGGLRALPRGPRNQSSREG